jgi:hypothetical protein
MAAAKGNQNAKGNRGGKSLNDRQLSASVRTLALKEIEKILQQEGLTEMKKAIVLKLAPTLLPRLNEHTGEDGGDINLNVISYAQVDKGVPKTVSPEVPPGE